MKVDVLERGEEDKAFCERLLKDKLEIRGTDVEETKRVGKEFFFQ